MLVIVYRDEIGPVIEDVEDETIEFFEGEAYFNDKKVSINDVVRVGQKED